MPRTPRPPTPNGDRATADTTRQALEALAARRANREHLVDPTQPAAAVPGIEATRAALVELARRRANDPDGSAVSGMWDRVVSAARPLMHPETGTHPRSPGRPPSGRRRRSPER